MQEMLRCIQILLVTSRYPLRTKFYALRFYQHFILATHGAVMIDAADALHALQTRCVHVQSTINSVGRRKRSKTSYSKFQQTLTLFLSSVSSVVSRNLVELKHPASELAPAQAPSAALRHQEHPHYFQLHPQIEPSSALTRG